MRSMRYKKSPGSSNSVQIGILTPTYKQVVVTVSVLVAVSVSVSVLVMVSVSQ